MKAFRASLLWSMCLTTPVGAQQAVGGREALIRLANEAISPIARSVRLQVGELPNLIVLEPELSQVVNFENTRTEFSEKEKLSIVRGAVDVQTADVDGDGQLDVIVTSVLTPEITVALGDGRGSIDAGYSKSLDRSGASAGTAFLDLDGDSHLDALVPRARAGQLLVLMPYFAENPLLLANPVDQPEFAIAGDFNGDKRQDVLVWGRGNATVLALFEGNAGGEFALAKSFAALPSPGGAPGAFAVADIDLDGSDDVLLLARSAEGSGAGLLYVLSRREGEYTITRLQVSLRIDNPVLSVVDITGDSVPDIVVLEQTDASVSRLTVFAGRGDGAMFFGTPCFFEIGDRASGFAVDDYDGDGVPDAALVLPDAHRIRVEYGPLIRCGGEQECYLVEKVDKSEKPAVGAAVLNAEMSSAAEVFFWSEAQTSTVRVTNGVEERRDGPLYGAGVAACAVADFDRDGAVDIAWIDEASRELRVSFLTETNDESRRIVVGSLGSISGLFAQDIDGDALTDLVVPKEAGSKSLLAFWGEVGGKFESRGSIPVGCDATAICAGDFDGDGVKDLVCLQNGADQVFVCSGRSARELGDPVLVRVIGDAVDLCVGDLDSDGRDEAVIVSRRASGITILKQEGHEFVRITSALEPGALPTAVRLVDMDGDSKPEVVLANSGTRDIGIHRLSDGLVLTEGQRIALDIGSVGDAKLVLSEGHIDRNGAVDFVVLDTVQGTAHFILDQGCGRASWFKRGDVNGDFVINLSDAIRLLSVRPFSDSGLLCEDAADVDDNGVLNLNDALMLLRFLFLEGSEPASPGPYSCGPDTLEDRLLPCRGFCF